MNPFVYSCRVQRLRCALYSGCCRAASNHQYERVKNIVCSTEEQWRIVGSPFFHQENAVLIKAGRKHSLPFHFAFDMPFCSKKTSQYGHGASWQLLLPAMLPVIISSGSTRSGVWAPVAVRSEPGPLEVKVLSFALFTLHIHMFLSTT